jgi:hypothetical protein
MILRDCPVDPECPGPVADPSESARGHLWVGFCRVVKVGGQVIADMAPLGIISAFAQLRRLGGHTLWPSPSSLASHTIPAAGQKGGGGWPLAGGFGRAGSSVRHQRHFQAEEATWPST